MTTQTQTFRTSDIYLIAYLLAKGCQVESMDYSSPRRTFFLFADAKKCNVLQQDFRNGSDQISARAYVDGMRSAKAMINAQRDFQ